jgi:hypothetical protein
MNNQNKFTLENKVLPVDKNGHFAQITVPAPALAQTRDTSISTSTEITLNSKTGLLEVTAIDDNVYLKYGTDDVTNANFDEFITAGATRHYAVPQGITAINLIDDGNGATVIVIEK